VSGAQTPPAGERSGGGGTPLDPQARPSQARSGPRPRQGVARVTGGVDPGLRRTGLAVVLDGRIVAAHEVRGEEGLTKVPAPKRAERVLDVSVRIAQEVADWMSSLAVVEIAVESYEWQGSDRGNLAHAWMVSMLVGSIVALLPAPYVVFRASEVQHPLYGYGPLLDAWRGGRRGVIPGDEVLSNEHKRDAACQALWAEATAWERRV
jgi:Holliday junction resolvasome RuvABC endonuclease subunit